MVLIFALTPYLILFLILVVATYLATRKLDKNIRPVARGVTSFLWLLGIWLYLFGDTIPLNREFDQLCREEAGYKIYRTLDISLEEFRDESGDVDWQLAENQFVFSRYAEFLNTNETLERLVTDIYFDDILVVRMTRIATLGGDFMKNLPSGLVCPKEFNYEEIYREIYQGED